VLERRSVRPRVPPGSDHRFLTGRARAAWNASPARAVSCESTRHCSTRTARTRPRSVSCFSQGSYQLDWAENGGSAEQARGSVTGWLSLFERVQLPYAVVDAHRRNGSQASGYS